MGAVIWVLSLNSVSGAPTVVPGEPVTKKLASM